ncbi:thioredoxin domain-containing protein [Candidatus Saccharibacteria bacterium]|nr:thioredoxin domain-containing protein [Candidatus Saccharibacteria bacterium]
MRKVKRFLPIILFVALLGVFGYLLFVKNDDDSNPAEDVSATELTDQQKKALEEGNVKLGQEATVNLVEFGDFQCPACKAAEPEVERILAQYGDQINFYFRHRPLITIHPNAKLAAIASEVAATGDKFWEMHDLLYQRQSEWSSLSSTQVIDTFANYGAELGFEAGSFREQILNETGKGNIRRDDDLAEELQVNGTPTFFVNGQRLASVTELEDKIKAAINGDSSADDKDTSSSDQSTEAQE